MESVRHISEKSGSPLCIKFAFGPTPIVGSYAEFSPLTLYAFEPNHSLPKWKSMTTDFRLSPLITLTLPSVRCPLGDATLTVSPVSTPRLDASDELRYMNPSGWSSSSHSLLADLDRKSTRLN